MRTLSIDFPRSRVALVAFVVCASVLVGYLYGVGQTAVLVALAGIAFFLLLVVDLRIVVPILIPLLPFGPKFAMSFGNLYLATIVVMVTLAAWVWRAPLLGRPLSLPRNRITDGLVFFLAALLISSMQDMTSLLANTLHLLRFVQLFLYVGLFFVFLQMSFSPRRTRMLLALILVAGITEGALGAWQWISGPGFYVYGTFDYAHSSYAVYLVFIILLVLGVAIESRSRLVIAGSIIATAVMLYPLAFSFSRGAYVALVGSIAVLFLMPFDKKRKAILALSITGLVLIVATLMPPDIVGRAETIISNLTGSDVGISFSGRLGMWGIALADFARSPLVGAGTWRYGLRDSFFMKIIGEAGLIGLTTFVWLLYVILRCELRMFRAGIKDDFIRGLTLGLFPATIGCLVIADFSIDLFLTHRFMGTFWLVLALMINYARGDGRLAHVES
ncbi:MAG: O-antigen ligase family protein [Candidatus Eisenbacteria bacterium]